jgi:DNA-directed RNA polymerase subunit RPC12/RpoP
MDNMLFYEYQCIDCGKMAQKVADYGDHTIICSNCGGMMGRVKINQDKFFIEDWGRFMRFFLNISFTLTFTFPLLFLFARQWLSSVIISIYLSIVIIAILSFIAFFRNLKRTEKYAAQERDIELVSRVIWEFNRSILIRWVIGKTETFIKEK